jgi:hypothetical protein
MDIEVYTFPTLRDGSHEVEELFCNLVNKYRNGETLPPEAIDWMDTANTWLMGSN